MEVTGTMSTRVRTSLSIMHRITANTFKGLADNLETQNGCMPTSNSDVIQLHSSYVMAAVITSAAYLEAVINEFFDDCRQIGTGPIPRDDYLRSISADKVHQMGNLWKNFEAVRRAQLFEKYNLALSLSGAQPFDKGTAPYQDANSVVNIRNKLMHAEPVDTVLESSIPSTVKPHEFETKLSKKFKANPLLLGQSPYFPQRMFSADCAKWSISSVDEFLKEFCNRLKIVPHWAPK